MARFSTLPLALLVGNISQLPYIMLRMGIETFLADARLVPHPEKCAYFNVQTLLLLEEAAQSLHTEPFPRAVNLELLHQWPIHEFRPRQCATITSGPAFVVEFVAVRGEGPMFQPVNDSERASRSFATYARRPPDIERAFCADC